MSTSFSARRGHRAACVAAGLAVLLADTACASGQLDPGFGDGGVLVMHVDRDQPFGSETAFDVLIDHAGRHVTVGHASIGVSGYTSGLITRHRPDGGADTTFGSDGVVHLETQTRGFMLRLVREQADGKLLVAGNTLELQNDHWKGAAPVICRLSEQGAPDLAFGDGGCRTLETVAGRAGLFYSSLAGVELHPDGGIVVLGRPHTINPDDPRGFALVRLLSNGDDDPEFGDTGCPNPAPRCAMAFSPSLYNEYIYGESLALDSQARILVAGEVNFLPYFFMQVVRYTPQGETDMAFAPLDFSQLTMDETTYHDTESLRIAADGSVFVVGTVQSSGKEYVALGKFGPDGKADATFGEGGRAVHNVDTPDDGLYLNTLRALTLQPDGKLVAGGYRQSEQATQQCFILRADDRTGALDAHFGAGGMTPLLPLNTYANTCLLTGLFSDERHILASGYLNPLAAPLDRNPFLLRLQQDALFGDSFDD